MHSQGHESHNRCVCGWDVIRGRGDCVFGMMGTLMCVCVCVCVCLCVCFCVCVCVCVFETWVMGWSQVNVFMRLCMYEIYICVCVCVCACVSACTCVWVSLCVCVHECMHVWLCFVCARLSCACVRLENSLHVPVDVFWKVSEKCVCVFVCVSLWVFASLCGCVSLCVWVCVCLCVYVCLRETLISCLVVILHRSNSKENGVLWPLEFLKILPVVSLVVLHDARG